MRCAHSVEQPVEYNHPTSTFDSHFWNLSSNIRHRTKTVSTELKTAIPWSVFILDWAPLSGVSLPLTVSPSPGTIPGMKREIQIASSILVYAASFTLVACGSNESASYRVRVSDQSFALRTTQSNPSPAEAEEPSKSDLNQCGDAFSGSPNFVTVSGSQQTVELEASDLLAVKVNGNQNRVFVDIEPTMNADMAGTDTSTPTVGFEGLCFILGGNQSRAKVSVRNFELGTFVVVGTGNEPQLELQVGKDASVDDFNVRIGGNQGTLTIEGSGEYSCPTGTLKGNETKIVCEK